MTSTTAASATFSPELENGLLARADELLADAHDREAAQRLQEASQRLDEAKAAKNKAVARLDEIALVFPTSTGPTRKKLNAERLELAGEMAFVPADIGTLGEHFVTALIPYATSVHHAATAAAARLNDQLRPLEARQAAAREARELVGGVDADTAQSLTAAGLPLNPQDIGAGEQQRADLGKQIDQRSAEIKDLRGRRDQFADLAAAAQRSLTGKFGDSSGFEGLYLASGVDQWLDALRHRIASHVSRYTGGQNLKPIGAGR